ncbi:50S ribosome-binding GTPase [Trichocoleus sp. FACHB-591]|uniref:GTPase n=1 Tax=Trichocoleus sp. FACHB-591 TaxID=2692872 RepID=UPI00168A0C88|nr:GTPase [Trichocoleus sp. FACHB-591]MBD2099183.1 50S ribosome-binding GTPase [Trichocoleus sp. FACHB-591]
MQTTEPVVVADEQLNYPFLLITHMVCADQQIHNQEAKSLRELASQAQVSQQTLDEMEKILAQDEQQLSIDSVAQAVPRKQRVEAIQQILAIAYVDGFCSPLEREMIEHISQLWSIPLDTIQRLLIKAESAVAKVKSTAEEAQALSFGARLLKGADSLLSRSLVNKLSEIAPQDVSRKVEQLRQEILLAGPEYDDAIHQCSEVAREDYKFAELALRSTYTALQDLGSNIQQVVGEIRSKTTDKGQAGTAKEVAKQLENTRRSLTAEIIQDLGKVRESLQAKQRALNHFSIAFMGRTKAGKSTLHAIVTNEGWDAIGVGKQRTTRYNRVYEWKNVRIIDTPGIGAPGGKTDEEIAQSIIEEADVVCYVVTNDNILQTEFNFLQALKERAKPLIVLLNVKHNLRDSRLLERFLQDPEKLLAMDGKSGLGGHIERIRRYAKQNYANDYFSIVPAMLIAAQISRETEDQKRKQQLFQASKLQDFLDSIRVSLIKHGVIRRSQTLLGSTVGSIEQPQIWLIKEAQKYEQLASTLQNKRKALQETIKRAEKDTLEVLKQRIEARFQIAMNEVQPFAESHWESNETSMKLGWESKLKAIKFEECLKIAYQESSQKFSQEVQEAIEEIGNELQLVAQLNSSNFKFSEQSSSMFDKDFVRIGGSVLVIAGAVLSFFIPPLGFAVGIAGTVAGLLSGLFKSREQKRSEAVKGISNSLTSQLEEQKKVVLQQAEGDFCKHCNSVATSIEQYFDELIGGLSKIASHLEEAQKKLAASANYLNRAYAKRILDYCLEQREPLTEANISKSVLRVKRDFGRSIIISTKLPLQSKKSLNELKEVLQENISIPNAKFQ